MRARKYIANLESQIVTDKSMQETYLVELVNKDGLLLSMDDIRNKLDSFVERMDNEEQDRLADLFGLCFPNEAINLNQASFQKRLVDFLTGFFIGKLFSKQGVTLNKKSPPLAQDERQSGDDSSRPII